MIRAYDNMYLDGAMRNLGAMFDYAVNAAGLPLSQFSRMFTASEVARRFGKGHPRYLAGLSGIELARFVIQETLDKQVLEEPVPAIRLSSEYWAGWALAYLQWYTGLPFSRLALDGISAETLALRYYPLHEADMTKVLSEFLPRIKSPATRLKEARKRLRLTQADLADRAGVSLRMIRAYEQGTQDLAKAEAATVAALARTLHCEVEGLV